MRCPTFCHLHSHPCNKILPKTSTYASDNDIVKFMSYIKWKFINDIIQEKRVNLEVVQGFGHAKH